MKLGYKILIGGIIALAIIGGLIWYYSSKKEDPQTPGETKEPELMIPPVVIPGQNNPGSQPKYTGASKLVNGVTYYEVLNPDGSKTWTNISPGGKG